MKQIFCPECGNSITVDNTKPFCFCTQCGAKIEMSNRYKASETITGNQTLSDMVDNSNQNDYLEGKLKEVEFYYKLSYDKQEYADTESQPIYYVKAQDILVDLSGEYENDFRIWWNLAKPVDYMCTEFVLACRNYEINEMYFLKALDAAKIADKMNIVKSHDEYVERKKNYIKQSEEQERQRLEQVQAEKAAQEQAERERAEQEQQEKLNFEKEQQAYEEGHERYEHEIQSLNFALWENLSDKNYEDIDGAYFSYTDGKSDIVTVVIKNISNMLHLIAYKKLSQNNTLYNMQTITVKIDNKGTITGFDNKPIVFVESGNAANIHYGSDMALKVNEFDLIADRDYIEQISKMAKKPLMKSKVFR